MKGNYFLLTAAAAALGGFGAGCGDNSRECGSGTTDMNGVCVGDGGNDCGEGTILDEASGACVIDPTSCQDGTVLVGGQCVDTGRVDVDIEEGAEPNGLGILGEDSAVEAGTITIKPMGQTFVIHGTIVPRPDADGDGQPDPDADTYLLEVNASTLIDVSADGLHGMSGAFLSLAAVVDPNDPLSAWTRFGVTTIGDTSKRQLFIPAPGLYILTVADTRSLFTGAAAGAEPNKDPFEYYVSISQADATPTPLTVGSGVGVAQGTLEPGEVQLFTVPMGLGFNDVLLDAPSQFLTESLVISNTSGGTITAKEVIDDDPNVDQGAETFTLGYKTGDMTVIAADHQISFATAGTDFDLVAVLGDAVPLKTDGTSASQSETAFPIGDVDNDGVPDAAAVFFYDVANDFETTGFDISFDQPVSTIIVDQDRFFFSQMTDLSGFETMGSYRGLFRHPTAGRYYWLVREPTGSGPTDITVTSTISAVSPGTITKDTPLTDVAIDATFESNAFNYAAGNVDGWQQFTGSGTGSGNVLQRVYDPNTAFGRLDDLVDSDFGGLPDNAPRFTLNHPAAGTTTSGRILLDDFRAMGNQTTFFVTVNTATVTGNPTFSLDYTRREHTDLGTLNNGQSDSKTAQVLDDTTVIQRYLVRSNKDNILGLTVTPSATLNTVIRQLNANESTRTTVNNGILGQPDTTEFVQGSDNWTAWTVTSSVPLVTGETFDQDLVVTATYDVANTATAFVDACNGGTVIATESGGDDDDVSAAAIDAPAGFEFFGDAAPQFNAFTNGFLSFDTALTCANFCFFNNSNLPNPADPNGIVAPYWDDIGGVEMCTKTDGTKVIVQWTGFLFNDGSPVAFQAILDGADNSIEFVWGGQQQADGGGATVGLENLTATRAKTISFNVPGSVLPNTSKKFTVP